jgi:hypothetical protein
MKNNQLTSVLIALLFLSTATTGWLMYKYNAAIHEIRELAPQVQKIGVAESLFQSILNDSIAYENATKNPEMTRLLLSLTNKPAMAVPKPAAK